MAKVIIEHPDGSKTIWTVKDKFLLWKAAQSLYNILGDSEIDNSGMDKD